MEQKRGQWGSNMAFLFAAIGSAVGLGNIWGFPYKMGINGGFAFLVIYVLLAIFVGVVVMLGELAIGRRTGRGAVGAYKLINEKNSWIGALGIVSAFAILSFYSVLGGMVLRYMVGFFVSLFGVDGFFGHGGDYFTSLLYTPSTMIIYYALFMLGTLLIVMGGIKGGIEKFTTIAMPALAIILVLVIGYVAIQPGAIDGYKFMFAPNFEPLRHDFFGVLKTAAGQMFFSLSLGMGCMITYGSYLSKEENLQKNAIIITLADTIIAVMAGMAVMPACAAFGVDFGRGPGLIFVSLQTVFLDGMGGFIGNLVGFLFYFLVFIAAITSSISLLEVCCAYLIDKRIDAGKPHNRKAVAALFAVLIFIVGLPVTSDALGSGGAFIPAPFEILNHFGASFGAGGSKVPMAIDCWLDLYDCLAEGILMPLGALIMSLLIGWKLGTRYIAEECEAQGGKFRLYQFFEICFKFIVPIGLIIILIAQIQDFFG
ncbi:MAG: sodium-dependent transporter [Oscillospiraceae bacterium]